MSSRLVRIERIIIQCSPSLPALHCDKKSRDRYARLRKIMILSDLSQLCGTEL